MATTGVLDTVLPGEDARSRDRMRRVALSAAAAALARGLGVVTSLITVPLVITYLGTERYGLWLTISSTIALLSFADLGIGNGLVTVLAEANGRDDRRSAAVYVSSAVLSLTAVAAVLSLGFAIAIPLVPWASMLNLTSVDAIREARPTVAVVAACFLLRFPLGVIERIRMGYQESYITHLWSIVGNLCVLGGLYLAIGLRAGLPWLVLALVGGPLVATALNGAELFGRRFCWLRPRPSLLEKKAYLEILSVGGIFVGLQIANLFAHQSDALIVARLLGASEVPQYAVPMKLFMYGPLLLGFVLNPLWPAYGEAYARGDTAWIKKTLTTSTALGLAAILPLAAALVLFGDSLIQLWVGPAIRIGRSLSVALGFFVVLSVVISSISRLLNGAKIFRFQLICSWLMAATNLPLSILLTYRMGVSGVVWGSVITRSLFVLIPFVAYLPILFRSLGPGGSGDGASRARNGIPIRE